ncbi:hypothetical protein BDW02DRAFT_256939 [Decorospora gaudefroyi]|uniref:Uncharacterized protein n=1 Tax=Decorospora gaudefroyi TaxID=184978 RepID=A0A6A5KJU2_9PLEO|nr:hypothetical protein BDW02DRAFT_256939 [Decorospora gaudefroyi]
MGQSSLKPDRTTYEETRDGAAAYLQSRLAAKGPMTDKDFEIPVINRSKAVVLFVSRQPPGSSKSDTESMYNLRILLYHQPQYTKASTRWNPTSSATVRARTGAGKERKVARGEEQVWFRVGA